MDEFVVMSGRVVVDAMLDLMKNDGKRTENDDNDDENRR